MRRISDNLPDSQKMRPKASLCALQWQHPCSIHSDTSTSPMVFCSTYPQASAYAVKRPLESRRLVPLFWPAEAVDVVFCVAIKQPTPLEIGCDLVTLVMFNTDNALPIIGCAVANVYLRSGAPILPSVL